VSTLLTEANLNTFCAAAEAMLRVAVTLLQGMQQLTLITIGWRLGKLQSARDQS
jgi:hypothetical protein